MISGSWPGEIFFFEGQPGRTFAAPRKLEHAQGGHINIGGGVKESAEQILITGDGEFKTDEEGKSFVEYQGKRYESTPERALGVTGTASAVFACDWDGDGDLDLLIGEIGGAVYWVPNEGTASAPRWGHHQAVLVRTSDSDVEALHVDGDAGPTVCDWDADGDLDLVVGDGSGAVSLFLNQGSRAAPQLAPAKILVPKSKISYPNPSEHPAPGIRSKVCVTDWDQDGVLDLLVGDVTYQKPAPKTLTEAEAAQAEKDRARLQEVRTAWGQAIEQLPRQERSPVSDPEQKAALKAVEALQAEMLALQEKVPPEVETHGWVWFLRGLKP